MSLHHLPSSETRCRKCSLKQVLCRAWEGVSEALRLLATPSRALPSAHLCRRNSAVSPGGRPPVSKVLARFSLRPGSTRDPALAAALSPAQRPGSQGRGQPPCTRLCSLRSRTRQGLSRGAHSSHRSPGWAGKLPVPRGRPRHGSPRRVWVRGGSCWTSPATCVPFSRTAGHKDGPPPAQQGRDNGARRPGH